MSFNLDLNKHAQEVIFSKKLNKSSHSKILFNNTPAVCANWQKHLGMFSDESQNEGNEGIGIIKKLLRHSRITTYKSFVRPHLDYGDIIYDQPKNESFNQKTEGIQYNAALAITGAIKGTSQRKLYNKLGFEYLKFRHWFCKLCTFYKPRLVTLLVMVSQ